MEDSLVLVMMYGNSPVRYVTNILTYFLQFLGGKLKEFFALSDKIGGDIAEQVSSLRV